MAFLIELQTEYAKAELCIITYLDSRAALDTVFH